MVLLTFLFMHFQPLPAQNEDKKEKKPTVPIIKIIPGIYQLKSGDVVKGGLLLGSFAGCITGAILENNRGNDYYGKYLDSINVEEIVKLRQNTESSFKKRNYYMAGVLGVWLIHLLDLTFFSKKKYGVQGGISKNRICISFYFTH